jgi:predicted flap endonuclease-1-like 5' DNA nuclease
VIWHFVEVWGLLLVAFAAGCLLGTLLYLALAASPLADAQVAAADAIAGGLGGFRMGAAGGREAGGYRRPGEPYPASAPEAYANVPPVDRDAIYVEAVEVAVDRIEQAPEPLEPDWPEEEGYWDDQSEDIPAPERIAHAPLPLPERPLPPPPVATAPEQQESQPELPAMRPLTLPGPRNGVPDNLQRIRGIGQKNEELLNTLGIYHFGQIAAWTPAEARWVASHLAFPERIERDDWIGQAIILATGGDTGYVKAADRRKGDEEPPVAA